MTQKATPAKAWLFDWRRVLTGFFRRILVSTLGVPRSPEWRRIRKEHLARNSFCAVCGRRSNLVPHHVIPVHVDPLLELSPDNLITLCEGPAFNCHLFFGHLRDWSSFNPDVRKDAEEWRRRIRPENP